MRVQNQSDVLMIIIVMLGTICVMRVLYLGLPAARAEMTSISNAVEDPWMPPFQ